MELIVNDLTKFLNLYLIDEVKPFGDVYLLKDINTIKNGMILIRAAGSTRGFIEMDSRYRILRVIIYDKNCYSKFGCFNRKDRDEITKGINNFIGTKINLDEIIKSI